MEINIKNAHLVLKKYLEGTNQIKYEHSIRVAKISEWLAKKWNIHPIEDTVIAALLHDIGKSVSKQEMLSLCARNNITIYDFELFDNETALHGRIGSLFFEEEFKGNDSERIKKISHAISSHVAGDEEMTILDKIIFIADYLDGKRESKELIEQIKTGEFKDPDTCVKEIIRQKIKKNKEKGREHNPLLDSVYDER